MSEITAAKTDVDASHINSGAILVVDDDALITAAIASTLRRAGYEASAATSPVQALELCAKQHFDLAIVDQRMPGMPGTELARQLLQQHDIHCLFLSAYDNVEFVNEAAAVGALSYLLKPIDPVSLLPAIHTALKRIADIRTTRQRESQLRQVLTSEREINTAVGILMERSQVTREDAFEMLRRYARSKRVQVTKVASEILQPINAAHAILTEIARTKHSLKPQVAGHSPDKSDG
ncbi:MAG: ANTAR domain-containing response regulator [Steroidobacteraceae bacterium]